VVIETPKGSRNKYAFDVEEKVFTLKKVLPAGMAFPYDFGFIPSTTAEDGDVDVLVLNHPPARKHHDRHYDVRRRSLWRFCEVACARIMRTLFMR
jgi:hypothetical protein